jgi:uncharacterized SAM-dependent methyltransferase
MKVYDRQFLKDSVALLLHRRVAHMGAHQYADHKAMRGDFPMSGALGWQRYEHDCPNYYILKYERELIATAVPDLASFLDEGTSLIDLGTGTLEAVESKSLPIVQTLQSENYVPIDTSLKFCSDAGKIIQKVRPQTLIKPSIENFFSDDVEPALDKPALGFLGGITIANIEAPISVDRPTGTLVKSLKNLAKIVGGGWLLLSTDANQSETENKAMYSENGLFEINTFDRMAHELPMAGLDPTGIVYDPVWIAESSQLAHTGVAIKTMSVEVESSEFRGSITIQKGDRFHLKNSFKYPDEYFLFCLKQAGFMDLKVWRHPKKPLRLFLLKAPAIKLPARHQEFIEKHLA